MTREGLRKRNALVYGTLQAVGVAFRRPWQMLSLHFLEQAASHMKGTWSSHVRHPVLRGLTAALDMQEGVPGVICMGGGYSRPIGATVEAHADVYRTAAAHCAIHF